MEKDNISADELSKFNRLASDWWDQDGAMKTLHQINPLRMEFISRHCQISGQKLLDIGCGGGILSESLARLGADVTGIDMAEELLQIAIIHSKKSSLSIQYEQTTAEALAHTHSDGFDAVTCMELLEHVPNPESMVKACATLVKADGHLFFSTINRNLMAWLQAIVAGEYLLKMIPIGTHRYEMLIRPSELRRYCQNHGIQLKEIRGIQYNPLTDEFFCSKCVAVNYMVHCIPYDKN